MQFNSPTGAGILSDVKLPPAKKHNWRLTYHGGGAYTLEDHGVTTKFATRKEYEDYLEKTELLERLKRLSVESQKTPYPISFVAV